MAFKCNGCNKTHPNSEDQTNSLGEPHYCSDCWDGDDEDDGGPDAAVQKKDRDDDDDSHPWEGALGGPYAGPK